MFGRTQTDGPKVVNCEPFSAATPTKLRDWLFIASEDFGRGPNVMDIMKIVSEKTGIRKSVLRGTRREKFVTDARGVVCYLAKELTAASFPAIGRLLNKDHSTCVFACHKAARRMKNDPAFYKYVSSLRAELTLGARS